MKTIEMTTCKIHMPVGTTKEQVETMLGSQGQIATFVDNHEVGSSKYSFAVVDLPQSLLGNLSENSLVTSIDLLNSFSLPKRGVDCSPQG
jgi:hypothetical protein